MRKSRRKSLLCSLKRDGTEERPAGGIPEGFGTLEGVAMTCNRGSSRSSGEDPVPKKLIRPGERDGLHLGLETGVRNNQRGQQDLQGWVTTRISSHREPAGWALAACATREASMCPETVRVSSQLQVGTNIPVIQITNVRHRDV